MLYSVNAVAWFYGCVAEIYPVEGFFTSLVLYLLVLSERKAGMLLWAALVLAIAGGFRLTTEVFLLPVYLIYLARGNRKEILTSLALLATANLLWLIPLVILTDGVDRYFMLLFRQTESAAASPGRPSKSRARADRRSD